MPSPARPWCASQTDVREKDVAQFKSFCMTDGVQASIGAYLESLKKKK